MRNNRRLGSKASDGTSVMPNSSPGLANFAQASNAMTHAVAAWAIHPNKARSGGEIIFFIGIRQRRWDEHERPIRANQEERRRHLSAVAHTELSVVLGLCMANCYSCGDWQLE